MANGETTTAPPPMPGGAGAVEAERAKLQATVGDLMKRMTSGGMGMPAPQPRFTPGQMKEGGFETGPAWNKKQDVGMMLGNIGQLLQNFGAQHKQRQMTEATADWQALDTSMQNAQAKAGPMPDPSSPEFQQWQQKVQEGLQQDPWVKSFLDPSNPKSVKRLKNMTKALNPDIFSDKQNVYGEAFKAFHKDKQMKQDQAKRQVAQAQLQQMAQQVIQQRIGEMMSRMALRGPDPKAMEATTRIMESALNAQAAQEFHKAQMEQQRFEFDERMRIQQADAKARLEEARFRDQNTKDARDMMYDLQKERLEWMKMHTSDAAETKKIAASEKTYEFERKELDKYTTPVEQTMSRLRNLSQTMAQNSPATDPLIAPELLTTMAGGPQSSLRMSEAEIARIVGGRNEWDAIKSKLNAWQRDPSKGFLLSPTQRAATRKLLNEVYNRLQMKLQATTEGESRLVDYANANDIAGMRGVRRDVEKQLNDIDAVTDQAAKPTPTFTKPGSIPAENKAKE